MKASDVIKILSLCPDAEVSVVDTFKREAKTDITISIEIINNKASFIIEP